MTAFPRTVVVGSGIIGSALAYALAKRGAPVTVVDEDVPANRATRGGRRTRRPTRRRFTTRIATKPP